MTPTPFSELAALCRALEATPKRKEKTRLLAEFLRGLEPEEVGPSVLLVVGSVFPEFDSRALEVGGRTVKGALEGSRQTTLFSEPLTVMRVYETLERIAEAGGPGSRRVKTGLLQGLLNEADPGEAEVLVRIIFGEMRIGVNEGVMLGGIAEAAGVESSLVRRALMMTGNLGRVAEIALKSGETGLKGVEMSLFTPLKPMLASMSYDVAEVLEAHGGESAFEFKLDGARIQIHRRGAEVRVFSRRLSDVTESLPDIVALVHESVVSENAVLEGEVVAVGEGGKPLPFQDLMRRFRRVHDVEAMVEKIPLSLHLFDVLYLDGALLIDEPYTKRRELLEKICPPELLVEQVITGDIELVEDFLRKAVEAGHEGLMAKRLDSVYSPGKRGKRWFKLKPVETLDLVVAAADWGYGRRTGWLSNYHLAARDGGGFRVIGKTFKGLTDEEFLWMTERLQDLKVRETPGTVHVRPELVVEVTFNEIQRSPHYASGFALRFARVTRIREDKAAGDADPLDRVLELYEAQFRYKAKADF
ncbi:MAG: ATP-dependent DNA ligase [Candidatus Bathyarchaeota archaeon]|nr:ATP-dependent DNA ligase [Candidatus Bathyarchaeota archaeon]